MLKTPVKHERDISSAENIAIACQVSLDSLLDVSAGIFQRALVVESGMVRSQLGSHSGS
jgi:hypothetical protein